MNNKSYMKFRDWVVKKTNLINIDCNYKAAGKQVKDNQRVYMYSSG